MRLLHVASFRIRNFDDEPPAYAIASHRWTDAEVTLQELSLPRDSISSKVGFQKIVGFCHAIRNLNSSTDLRVEYLWIDTCCIDKTNSVELQEALNSMFRWYAEAEACLVYLHDMISLDSHPAEFHKSFQASGWFTRGWTLQELLAPKCNLFYNADWELIGRKSTAAEIPWMTVRAGGLMLLNPLLAAITSIPEKVLYDFHRYIEQYSIEEKRSWMNGRSTTRKEDRVYCQLGIFGVFMPLIYGEGDHAMYRLEEAIEQKQRRLEAQARGPAALPVLPWAPEIPSEKRSGGLEGQESRTSDRSRGKDVQSFTIYYGNQTSYEHIVVEVRDDISVDDLTNRVLANLDGTVWNRKQKDRDIVRWGLSSSGSRKDLLDPRTRVAELNARNRLSLLRRG